MSKWKLTLVEDNEREDGKPLDEIFYYNKKDYCVKQALYIIADDDGLFETKEELENVKKQLEDGRYEDEYTNVTYTIEETEEEGDDKVLNREAHWEGFDVMSLVDGYGEDEDFEDEDDWDEDDDDEEDDDWDEDDDFEEEDDDDEDDE